MAGPTNLNLWRANGLPELGELAREAGMAAALAQPLSSVLALLPAPTAKLLQQLPSAPPSIEALLEDRHTHRALKQALGSTGYRELLRAAREALEAHADEHPPTTLPPLDPDDVIDWAFDAELDHVLDEPLAALLGLGDDPTIDLARRAFGQAPIGAVLKNLNRYDYGEALLRWQRPFMFLLQKHLVRRGAELAEGLSEERDAPLAPLAPTASARLRALDEALVAWRAVVRQSALPRPRRLFIETPISIQPEPPIAIWSEWVIGPNGPLKPHVQVVLDLEDFSPRTPRVRCSTCEGPACTHALAAIDRLRVQLRASSPETLASVEGMLAQTKWERALSGLARARNSTAAVASTEVRIAWRLTGHGFGVRLEPLLQKNGKRGFSKGSLTSPDQLASDRSQQFLPADRRAGAMMVADRNSYGAVANRGVLALEALQGHPRVFHQEDPTEPVRIAVGRLSLQCQTQSDGGFTLTPAIEGTSLTLNDLVHVAPGRALCFDPARHTCWLVEVTAPFLQALSPLRKLGNTFPPEAADLIADALGPEGFAVDLPRELLGDEVPARLDAAVYLTPIEGLSTEVEIRVRPLPGALPLPAGAGPEVVRGKEGQTRVFTRRDLAKERAAALELLGTLGLPMPTELSGPVSVEGPAVLDLLKALEQRSLEGLEVHLPPIRPKLLRPMRAKDLRLSVKDGGFWFGLEGEAQIDDQKISLALVLEAARRRQRYVKVSEDQFIELSTELSRQLEPVADSAFPSKHGDEIGISGVASLEALAQEAHSFRPAQSFAAIAGRLKTAESSEPKIPAGLTAALRPYQVDGFRWLAGLTGWASGGVLADDMGLGKTLQALALLQHRSALGPAMVLAPTSVCFNWEREAARFAKGLRFHSWREADRDRALAKLGPGDVLVVSYGLLVRDAEKLKGLKLATLVVDEAQALKNSDALRTRAARGLDAQFRVALTGTPIENHLGELWSLFGVVFPGLLGSLEQFRERFVATGEGAALGARRLSRVLKPFLLRRTKGEVATELPPRIEVTVEVALTAEERRLYEQARLAAMAELAGGSIDGAHPEQKRFKVLAALTRLRLLACHPKLHDSTWTGPASKLQRLLELITELKEEGHRALVFSQFTKHLAMVREALDAAKIAYVYLDGSTPEKERRARVDAFQQGTAPVFLISLKAGGTGLNLTAADNVIHLDPWWNPAVEDQATDRAHRIGQSRPVTVYRLVTSGTIEEKILALHGEKRGLVAQVLEGTDVAAKLSTDDLIGLLEKSARLEEGELDEAPPTRGVPDGALLEKFGAWLGSQALGPAPLRTYPRAVARFLTWRGGTAAPLDVAAEGPRYLAELSSGRFAAPKSEPMLAKPALKMLAQFLGSSER